MGTATGAKARGLGFAKAEAMRPGGYVAVDVFDPWKESGQEWFSWQVCGDA